MLCVHIEEELANKPLPNEGAKQALLKKVIDVFIKLLSIVLKIIPYLINQELEGKRKIMESAICLSINLQTLSFLPFGKQELAPL